MNSDKDSDSVLKRFQNRQFGFWLLVAVPSFVVTVTVLESAGASIAAAVAVGIVLGEALDPIMYWLIDWHEAEKEVEAL